MAEDLNWQTPPPRRPSLNDVSLPSYSEPDNIDEKNVYPDWQTPPPRRPSLNDVPLPSYLDNKGEEKYNFSDFYIDKLAKDIWENDVSLLPRRHLTLGKCIIGNSSIMIEDCKIYTIMIIINNTMIKFRWVKGTGKYSEFSGIWRPLEKDEVWSPPRYALPFHERVSRSLEGFVQLKNYRYEVSFDQVANDIISYLRSSGINIKDLISLKHLLIRQQGGHIFQGTFQMTPLKFIWAVIVVIVISIMITLVGGLVLYGVKFFQLPNITTALVTLAIGILMIYAPYDYIYTMGYDDHK
jgi:hypothetical protein